MSDVKTAAAPQTQAPVAEALPLPGSPDNPSAPQGVTANTRIPLSVPRQKLQVPEIPGYHTRWMRNTEQRIAAALQAGYEFVSKEETLVANHGVASSREDMQGTDLGSRVTVYAGGTNDDGQATRLVLMKLRREFREQDEQAREERGANLVRALRGGKLTPEGEGPEHRYVRHGNILAPKRRSL